MLILGTPRSLRLRALALAAAVIAGSGVLAGCSGPAAAVGAVSGAEGVNSNLNITQIPVASRSQAPRLAGTTITGASYTTSYLNHVTVVNIFGSWCSPCIEEAPSFAEASKKYAAKGVQFLGIDTLDNDSAGRAYDSKFGITYPALADPDQTIVLGLKSLVPTMSVPSTIIIDKSGKVAVRVIGGITEPELIKELDYALSAG